MLRRFILQLDSWFFGQTKTGQTGLPVSTPIPSARANGPCFGRVESQSKILRLAWQYRCVLLFGGRQAGKTTLLRRIEHDLLTEDDLHDITICAYVDCLAIDPLRGPGDVFREMARIALQEAERKPSLAGVKFPTQAESSWSVQSFLIALTSLTDRAAGRHVRFLFLFDEAKRILPPGMPRALQDNFFAMLYGGSKTSLDIALVFAGAQDLYALSADSTSPLASRSGVVSLPSLEEPSVVELLGWMRPGLPDAKLRARLIHGQTGGQAGLTTLLARASIAENSISENEVEKLGDAVMKDAVELFRSWWRKLTPEARLIHNTLMRDHRIEVNAVPGVLRAGNGESFLTDRAMDELCFSGIAELRDNHLVATNAIYWKYLRGVGGELVTS